MKIKEFRSYYFRLTLFSLVVVFFLVFIITFVALVSLHNNKTADTLGVCDKILVQMSECYDDIWNNYYKAFLPLTEDAYAEKITNFCRGGADDYSDYIVQQDFRDILVRVCQKDERIQGIYVKRFSDDTSYLYSDVLERLDRVSYALENEDEASAYQRTMIGGQVLGTGITTSAKKHMQVFGIQSKVLSAKGGDDSYPYQITVLYGLDSFDEILAKYEVNPQARFMIVSPQGLVVYDSKGDYAYKEETYFVDVGKVTREEDTLVLDQVTYMKNLRFTGRGNYLVFYMIPRSEVEAFQLSGTMGLVIASAVIIMVVICMVLFSVNRLTGQKFQQLESGMRQVGKNNLSYRIPVGKQEDEFARIAARFNKMCDDLENMINKNYVYQVLQQNAEYKALQTSVNPHFLYNSLEAIREKMTADGQEDEAEMILLLSRIFEYQIRGNSTVTIQRELNALQNYIDFSAIRLDYAFEYSVNFDEEILTYKIPKQIFQPIMENYFSYGFRGDGTDYIYILGYIEPKDDMIHICFCDNGKGMSPEKLEWLNASLEAQEDDTSHMGLRNVHHRLKIAYGKESHVEIVSNAPEPGISVSLVFGRVLKIL